MASELAAIMRTVAASRRSLLSLTAELQQLEREERELSALRRKLHERLASFPNELTEAREREISKRRRKLHRRIDAVQAELKLLGSKRPEAAS